MVLKDDSLLSLDNNNYNGKNPSWINWWVTKGEYRYPMDHFDKVFEYFSQPRSQRSKKQKTK
jgi:hypothetical protein